MRCRDINTLWLIITTLFLYWVFSILVSQIIYRDQQVARTQCCFSDCPAVFAEIYSHISNTMPCPSSPQSATPRLKFIIGKGKKMSGLLKWTEKVLSLSYAWASGQETKNNFIRYSPRLRFAALSQWQAFKETRAPWGDCRWNTRWWKGKWWFVIKTFQRVVNAKGSI